MAAHKFRPFELEKIRAEIADLRVRGFRSSEIAERVGLRRQTVDHHLGVIEARWRASAVAALVEHRARLLAASEQRKRELSDAWERSKRERKSTVTRHRELPAVPRVDGVLQFPRATGTPTGVEREARVRLDERDPDWHYLDAVRREDELQAKLLGLLEEPPKPETSDEPVRRIVVYLDRGDEPIPSDSNYEEYMAAKRANPAFPPYYEYAAAKRANEALPPGDGPVIDVGTS